jgi:hypothetical protein
MAAKSTQKATRRRTSAGASATTTTAGAEAASKAAKAAASASEAVTDQQADQQEQEEDLEEEGGTGYNYTNFASVINAGVAEINGVAVRERFDKLEESRPEGRQWNTQGEISETFELNPMLSVLDFVAELADLGIAVRELGSDMYKLSIFET